MATSSGGLHYSRDETAGVHEPQLDYSNPHGQRVGPRWVRGEVVFAMPLGIVNVDPEAQKWANEYVVVYTLDGPDGRPERVPGQFGYTIPNLGTQTIALSGATTT